MVYYGGTQVSIIIPVRNEAENIRSLAEELAEALKDQLWTWECIWIDDGSTDQSLSILEELSREFDHHRVLSLDRPSGQSAALWAGFINSKGAILVTIDGDGQNDPDNIPHLVDLVDSGLTDMANGYRVKREDDWLRIVSSRIANAFRNVMTGKTVRDTGCAIRAFRRECIEHLPLFSGMHRFLPTLVAIQDFRQMELPVNHRPRKKGKTKYAVGNRLWVGLADTFGVLWLRKRGFRFEIKKRLGR
ncbi:MAG: glycosyltransferase family 2 protein [Syntrophobacteraceae bacterium]